MNIAIVDTTEKTRRGARSLAEALLARDHTVIYVLPERSAKYVDISAEIEYRFYETTVVPHVRYTLASRSFYETIRTVTDEVDILHVFSYFYPPCTLAAMEARRQDTTCIVTVDSLPGISWSYGTALVDVVAAIYTHTLGRLTFWCADRVVALGEYLVSDLEAFAKHEKVEVIPNGIDVSEYTPSRGAGEADASLPSELTPGPPETGSGARQESGPERDPVALLFVGRLNAVKGVPLLLEAVLQLNTGTGPQYHLTVVGDGSKRADYEAICEELGIREHVTFVGHADETVDYYRTHDVLVLSSISEGQPNVVMEAQACGTPVVVTDVGAAEELIGVGELVESRDCGALAAAIERVADGEDDHRSAAARSFIANNYSQEMVGAKYVDLYSEEFRVEDTP